MLLFVAWGVPSNIIMFPYCLLLSLTHLLHNRHQIRVSVLDLPSQSRDLAFVHVIPLLHLLLHRHLHHELWLHLH
jgi:hypothetical protein